MWKNLGKHAACPTAELRHNELIRDLLELYENSWRYMASKTLTRERPSRIYGNRRLGRLAGLIPAPKPYAKFKRPAVWYL